MDEVKLIEDLYLGSREEAIAAINAKGLWIDKEFYMPGNLDLLLGDDGEEHFALMEALFNNVLLFNDIDFSNPNFDESETKLINKISYDLSYIDLYDEIDDKLDVDFWVLYDFNKMEKSMYEDFVANIYHKLPYEVLKINKDKLKEKSVDLMKSLIIGEKGQSRLIVSKDKLQDMCYYCPILKGIYYKKTIRPKLLAALKEIATKYNLDIEEINEN